MEYRDDKRKWKGLSKAEGFPCPSHSDITKGVAPVRAIMRICNSHCV